MCLKCTMRAIFNETNCRPEVVINLRNKMHVRQFADESTKIGALSILLKKERSIIGSTNGFDKNVPDHLYYTFIRSVRWSTTLFNNATNSAVILQYTGALK